MSIRAFAFVDLFMVTMCEHGPGRIPAMVAFCSQGAAIDIGYARVS
jgi:hypothetical protein